MSRTNPDILPDPGSQPVHGVQGIFNLDWRAQSPAALTRLSRLSDIHLVPLKVWSPGQDNLDDINGLFSHTSYSQKSLEGLTDIRAVFSQTA